MDTSMILLVPVLVLGVVGLFAFAGCTAFGTTDTPAAKPEEKKPDPPKNGNGNGNGNGTVKVPEAVDAYPNLIKSLGGSTGNLRSYWRLAEALASQKAEDSEPTQPQPGDYKGTVTLNANGVLRLGSDANDVAAEFNGTNAHVNVPHSPLVKPTDAFTLEAWVHPDPALAAGAVAPIITAFQAQGSFGFFLALVGQSATLMKAQIQCGGGNLTTLDADVQLDTPAATARDGWHHIVATFGKDAGVNKLRLYVNAGAPTEKVAGGPQPLNYKPAPEYNPGDAPFRIGAGPGATPTAFFKGRIDEVALYDAALDGTVVGSHFTQATKKFK
jgi:hypothetical protein